MVPKAITEQTIHENEWAERASGLIVPEHIADEMQLPRAIDLFCGAGGMSCGLIAAGFEVVAASDNDPLCAITYTMNLGTYPCQFHFVSPEDEARLAKALGPKPTARTGSAWIKSQKKKPGVGHFFLGDIRGIKGDDLLRPLGLRMGELDLLAGAPPCQGFSVAGKRNVMDPRNSLVFEFARLVVEIKPKTLMFENVPGILSMVTPQGIGVVDEFCRILEDGGYGTVNAFKQAIGAQTGCVGLMRGRGKKNLVTEKAKAKGKAAPTPKQEALFA